MDKFLQLSFAGTAEGVRFALVALGFVIIYKATHVINFAQGGFVVLGAFLSYNFTQTWDLPFALGALLALVTTALVGIGFEALILRRMVGQPVFAVIMITIGMLIIINQVVTRVWGFTDLDMGDPWGIDTIKAGDIVLNVKDLWTIGITGVVLLGFFAFFRYSRLGVAMRATALDQEAALAQGISARRVFAASWGISGFIAALAGVMLGSGAGQVNIGIGFIALAAFPAIILGGLDSPGGAVIGGVLIGLTKVYTAGYQSEDWWPEWTGSNFHTVMPYLVMIVILMIRPYGLFGTKEVRRV
jgi:branched-chain amino acid transport system permease protein